MLKGLIPAAGYSSRMGQFKPLLKAGGRSLLERAISSLREGGVEEIWIVTGFRAEEVREEASRLGCRTVHNQDYPEGMYSSVKAGVRALGDFEGAFFFLPGDIPLVRPSTIRYMANSFSPEDHILIPSFRKKRGHPPLLPAHLCMPILNYGGEGGLRGFMDVSQAAIRELPVADRGILQDADTPRDLDQVLELAASRELPDREETLALLEMAGTAPEVIAHQEKVAQVALRLADTLTKNKVGIDRPLLERACLLHDILRHRPSHGAEGAAFLHEQGFPRLADLVEDHMDIREVNGLDERALLYLSDKMVSGTRIVDIEGRMKERLRMYGYLDNARKNITRRMGKALAIQEKIEALTGLGIKEILDGGATDES